MKVIQDGKNLFVNPNGNPYTVTSDNPLYPSLLEAVLNDAGDDAIEEICNKALGLARYTDGEITAEGGNLMYEGQVLHGVVINRIAQFKKMGLPYEPLIAFVKRLMKNPSARAVRELFGFLEKNQLPITEDGFILGYKGVTSEYKDVHTQRVDNRVGAVIPRMNRFDVDDDHTVECSNGYHIGSREYATGFGARTIIVKFDPADVISVPSGESSWKVRVCFYQVISDYDGPMNEVVVSSKKPYQKGIRNFLRCLFRRTPGVAAMGPR
jgi:hypothetical protein